MNEIDTIKPLIRAMRTALLRDHNVDVPYTALRAAYLNAKGENSHARCKGVPANLTHRAEPAVFVPLPGDWVVKRLHLVEDEVGCLSELSLDPDGQYIVDSSWVFHAKAVALDAQVPKISKYGLPDYIQSPQSFFREFDGLELEFGTRIRVQDLGDDSGDTAEVWLALPGEHWDTLLRTGIKGSKLYDAASEWAGLHYKVSLPGLTIAKQVEYVNRFLEATQELEELPRLEWVWPDEDSDYRVCWVDPLSGSLTLFGEVVPTDITEGCRIRMVAFEDDMYTVKPVRGEKDEVIGWRLIPRELTRYQKAIQLDL